MMTMLWRCALGGAILSLATAAEPLTPLDLHQSTGDSSPPPAAAPPVAPPASPGAATLARGGALPAPIVVSQWGFSESSPDGGHQATPTRIAPGQRLYLSMTLSGSEAAAARMRAQGALAIDVHWTHAAGGPSPAAPDLVTQLHVGHRGLAPKLAAEARRQGHFEWHTWARKDTLSPGQWSVSLTYGDGQPVLCGRITVHPCRFAINVG